MNRGLIEAANRSRCVFAQETLPRFMNRGLIEAGLMIFNELSGSGPNFPDS